MTSTILFADRIEPDSPKLPTANSTIATTVGSSSIFLWAVWPTLAVYAAPAPTFQVLAIGMTIGFLVLAALRVGRGEPLLGTPLVATLLLVVFGLAEVTMTLLGGAVLVVLGAAVGTWPSRQAG